jgi:hypothetical protein
MNNKVKAIYNLKPNEYLSLTSLGFDGLATFALDGRVLIPR